MPINKRFGVTSESLENLSGDELQTFGKAFFGTYKQELDNVEEARASGEAALDAFRNQKTPITQPAKPTLPSMENPKAIRWSALNALRGLPQHQPNQPTQEQQAWAKDWSNYNLPQGVVDRLNQTVPGMNAQTNMAPKDFAQFLAKYHPEYGGQYIAAMQDAMEKDGADQEGALIAGQKAIQPLIDQNREYNQYLTLMGNADEDIDKAITYQKFSALDDYGKKAVLDAYDEAGLITWNDEQPDYDTAIKNAYFDQFQRGNVDLRNRPKVSADSLAAAGWNDAGSGTATVFSMQYDTLNSILHLTPIRADGTVLSPDEMDAYAQKLEESGNAKEADDQGLLLWEQPMTGDMRADHNRATEFDNSLHEAQADFYGLVEEEEKTATQQYENSRQGLEDERSRLIARNAELEMSLMDLSGDELSAAQAEIEENKKRIQQINDDWDQLSSDFETAKLSERWDSDIVGEIAKAYERVTELQRMKQAGQDVPELEEAQAELNRLLEEHQNMADERIQQNANEFVGAIGTAASVLPYAVKNGMFNISDKIGGSLEYLNDKGGWLSRMAATVASSYPGMAQVTPEQMQAAASTLLSESRKELRDIINDVTEESANKKKAVADALVNIGKSYWTEQGWKDFGNEEQIRQLTDFIMTELVEATGIQIGQQLPSMLISLATGGAGKGLEIFTSPEYYIMLVSDFCSNLTERYDEARAGGKELSGTDLLFMTGESLVNAFIEFGLDGEEAYRAGLVSLGTSILGEIKEEVLQDKNALLWNLIGDAVQGRPLDTVLFSNDKNQKAFINSESDVELIWQTALTTFGMDAMHDSTIGIVQKVANGQPITYSEQQTLKAVTDRMIGQDPGSKFEQSVNGENPETARDKPMPAREQARDIENNEGTRITNDIPEEVQQQYADLDDDTLQTLIDNTEDNLSQAQEGTSYYRSQEQILNEARAVMENRRNGTTKTGRQEPSLEGTTNEQTISSEPGQELPEQGRRPAETRPTEQRKQYSEMTLEELQAEKERQEANPEGFRPDRKQALDAAIRTAEARAKITAQTPEEFRKAQLARELPRNIENNEDTTNPNNIPATNRYEEPGLPDVPQAETPVPEQQEQPAQRPEGEQLQNEEALNEEQKAEQEARAEEVEGTEENPGNYIPTEGRDVPPPQGETLTDEQGMPRANEAATAENEAAAAEQDVAPGEGQAAEATESIVQNPEEPAAPETTPVDENNEVEPQSKEGNYEEEPTDEGELPHANTKIEQETEAEAKRSGFKAGKTNGDGRYDTGVHLVSTGGNISENKTKVLQIIDRFAKHFGFSVEAYNGDPVENGFYRQGGRIVSINLNTENPFQTVLSHEAFHMVKSLNPKSAQQIESIFDRYAAGAGFDVDHEIDLIIAQYARAGKLDSLGATDAERRAGAKEELIANSMYSLLSDEQTMRRIYAEDRNLFQRIMDWVSKVQQSIQEMLNDYADNTPEARMLRDQQGALEELHKAMLDALEEMKALDDAKKAAVPVHGNGVMTREYQRQVKNATNNREITEAARSLAEAVLKKTRNEVTQDNVTRLMYAAQEVQAGSLPAYALINNGLSRDSIVDPETRRAMIMLSGYMNELMKRGDVVEYQALVNGETQQDQEVKQNEQKADDQVQEAVKPLENDGLVQGLEGGTVVKNSLTTWWDTDKRKIRQQLKKAGFKTQDINKWIDDVESIAAMIAQDRDRLDYKASTVQTFLKDNAEYVKTLDSSTLCAKRRLYQGTFDAIQHALPNTVITSDMLIHLRNMMAERNYETPCGICYVESRRRNLGTFTERFIKNYEGDSTGYKPTMDDLTTMDGLEDLRTEHPEAYEAYRAAMAKTGSNNPKVVQPRTEYRGEILQLTPGQVQKIVEIGGLRVQSFSDFETPHLIDMMQAVLDMSEKKLTSQAYTKVPNFAAVFGGTGIKINLSLIADGTGLDENGNLVYSSYEGMDIKRALELRDQYPDDVGTILVGVSDQHILAAMASDDIDFIIPFHKSGWGKKQLEQLTAMRGYHDYTADQNERRIVGTNKNGKPKLKKVEENFHPVDYWDYKKSGKQNAEVYLRMCAEDGRIPKFARFLVNNGDSSYSLQPDGSTDGYWKLLGDFKMYNHKTGKGTPQRAVTPNFNMEEAERVLHDYEGGADTLPVAQDVVNDFVEEYKTKHPRKKYSLTADDRQRDAEYMKAVESGDEQKQQEMVDQAAKDAGYVLSAYHGTGEHFNTFKMGYEGIHLGNKEQAEQVANTRYEMRSAKTRYKWDDIKNRIGEMDNDTRMELVNQVFGLADYIDNYERIPYFDGHITDENEVRKYVTDSIKAYMEETGDNSAPTFRISTFDRKVSRNLMKLYAKIKNPVVINGDILQWTPWRISETILERASGKDHIRFENVVNITGTDIQLNDELIKELERIQKAKVTDETWSDLAEVLYQIGFDGIKYKNTYEGDKNSYSYIALKPSDVKSADPVTYDDQGNVIPLSERFNTESNDIRYSLDEEGARAGQEMWDRQQEYTGGESQVLQRLTGDLWTAIAQRKQQQKAENYGQWKAHVAEMARTIKAETNSTVFTEKQLEDRLTAILEEHEKMPHATREEAENAINNTLNELQGLIQEALSDQLMDEHYKEVKSALKNGIYINPDQVKELGGAAELRDFRNALSGFCRVYTSEKAANAARAMHLDGAGWEELQSIDPDVFNPDTHWLERAQALRDFVDLHTDSTMRDDPMTRDYIRSQALATLTEYYIGSNETDATKRTRDALKKANNKVSSLERQLQNEMQAQAALADQLKAEKKASYEKLNQVQNEAFGDKTKLNQQLQEAQAQTKATSAELTQALKEQDRLRNELDAADNKAAYLENTVRLLRKQNKQNQEAAVRDYKNRNKGAAERRAADKRARDNIKKTEMKMRRMLEKPSNTAYVPLDKVRKLLDMVEAIQKADTRKAAQASESWMRAVRELREDTNSLLKDAYDEGFIAQMQEVADIVKDKTLNQLSSEELQYVSNVMTQALHQIENATKMIGRQKNADALVEGHSWVDTLNAQKPQPTGGIGKVVNNLATEHLTPQRELDKLAGYRKDNAIYRAKEELSEGQRVMNKVKMDQTKNFVHLMTGENAKNYKKWYGKNAEVIDTGIQGSRHGTFKMTHDFLTSLYLHNMNQQNLDGMKNGLTVPDYALWKEGKHKEAWDRAERMYVTADDMKRLMGKVTDYDKAWAKAWKQNQAYITPILNDVSMQLNGWHRFAVENYFPIRRDRNYLATDFDSIMLDDRIASMGFTKMRKNAKNPMMLESMLDVVNRTINGTSLYAGMLIPVTNFNKAFNMSMPDFEDSPKAALRRVWGNKEMEYIERMMKDLQQAGIRADESIFDKVRSKAAPAALGANMTVVIKQAASYPTAAAVLGWKPLAQQLTKPRKFDQKITDKYTSAYWERSDANIQAMNANVQSGGIDRTSSVLNKPIGAMDRATVRMIWGACEYAVEEEQPNLKRGSDEYYEAVARKYEECLEMTQPEYGTMQRPHIMRSNNTLQKAMTMYKTQSFQNMNIVYDAVQDFRTQAQMYKQNPSAENKAEVDRAKTKLARAVSSQIVSATMLAVMTAVGKALLHKPEPYQDDKGEVTAASAAYQMSKDAISSMAGMVTGGSELFDLITGIMEGKQPYDIDASAISMINDLYQSMYKLGNAATIIGDGSLSWDKKLEKGGKAVDNFLKSAGAMLGIPYRNLMNIKDSVVKYAEDILSGRGLEGLTTGDVTLNTAARYMGEALQRGDKDAYVRLYNRLLKQGKTNSQINSAMKSWMKTSDPRIQQAATAIDSGDIDTYNMLINQMTDAGYGMANVVTAIEAVRKAGAESAEGGAQTEQTEYAPMNYDQIIEAQENADASAYTYAQMNQLLDSGNTRAALQVQKALFKSKGTTAVKSALTSYWKPKYQEAYQNRNRTELNRITRLLKTMGYSDQSINKWKNVESTTTNTSSKKTGFGSGTFGSSFGKKSSSKKSSSRFGKRF